MINWLLTDPLGWASGGGGGGWVERERKERDCLIIDVDW